MGCCIGKNKDKKIFRPGEAAIKRLEEEERLEHEKMIKDEEDKLNMIMNGNNEIPDNDNNMIDNEKKIGDNNNNNRNSNKRITSSYNKINSILDIDKIDNVNSKHKSYDNIDNRHNDKKKPSQISNHIDIKLIDKIADNSKVNEKDLKDIKKDIKVNAKDAVIKDNKISSKDGTSNKDNEKIKKTKTGGVSIELKIQQPTSIVVVNDKPNSTTIKPPLVKSQDSNPSKLSVEPKNSPKIENKPSIQQLVSVSNLPIPVLPGSGHGYSLDMPFTIREQTEPDPTYQPSNIPYHIDSVDIRLHKTEQHTDKNIEMLIQDNEERVDLIHKPCFSNFLLTREALQSIYIKKEEQKLDENNKEIIQQENKKYQELYDQVAGDNIVHHHSDTVCVDEWFTIDVYGECGIHSVK